MNASHFHDGKKLLALMHKATLAGIKFPKIKLTAPDPNGNKLVCYLNGSRSNNHGGITITDGDPYPDNVYYGKITSTGQLLLNETALVNNPVIAGLLQQLLRDPVTTAAVSGRRTGVCCFCARHLDTKESIAAGYGPICAEKYGLPWGGDATATKADNILPEI